MLENLSQFIGAFRFAWGTERKVEGGHAQVNMLSASRRNRHEATDSLSLRLGEIKRVLSAENIASFLECVQAARNPRRLVRALGLAKHPSCAWAKSNWDPIFRKIVYHADPFSSYQRRQPALFVAGPAGRPPAPARGPLQALGNEPAEGQDIAPEVVDMQHGLALRYVRERLSQQCQQKDNPKQLFSCNIPRSALRLLSECLAPSAPSQNAAGPVQADAGNASSSNETSLVQTGNGAELLLSDASQSGAGGGAVFFRIVGSGLSRAKLAGAADFDKHDIGISLLRGSEAGVAHDSCQVETSAMRLRSPVAGQCGVEATPLVLSLSCLSLAQLQSLTMWDESKSVTADVQTGITRVQATAPMKALAIRSELPLADRSMYELVQQLLSDGWECAVARNKQLQTGLPNMAWVVLLIIDVSFPYSMVVTPTMVLKYILCCIGPVLYCSVLCLRT